MFHGKLYANVAVRSELVYMLWGSEKLVCTVKGNAPFWFGYPARSFHQCIIISIDGRLICICLKYMRVEI
jgi:hypothetical protein